MKKSIRILPALLLAGVLSAASAPAAEDPFVRAKGQEVPEGDNSPKFVSVCLEAFSLSLADAAMLYHGQPNDTALYKEVTSRAAKGKAKQEAFVVLRARSGEKALLENVSEFSYPVSYLPAAKPDGEQAPPPAPKPNAPAAAPVTPAPPTSALPFPTEFMTRNVGVTLEIEPTIGGNDRIIDLRIQPDFVTLADRAKWGQGESATETPVFEVQTINTANTLIDGQPQLLGTMSRPPVSKVDADSAERVWLTFITANIVTVARDK